MLPRLPCVLCQLPGKSVTHKFWRISLLSFIPPSPLFYFSGVHCCNNNNSNNNSTIYYIHHSGKLKLLLDFISCCWILYINVQWRIEFQITLSHFFKVMKHTHIHIIRHTPPVSQSTYYLANPKLPGVMFSQTNHSIKTLKLNEIIPSLGKLSSSADVLTHAHTQLMTAIIFIKMPGESYCRRLRSLLLYLCYVCQALTNSLVCNWFLTNL